METAATSKASSFTGTDPHGLATPTAGVRLNLKSQFEDTVSVLATRLVASHEKLEVAARDKVKNTNGGEQACPGD